MLLAFPGRLAWQSRALETLFTWIPYLLPKHFSSFVLDLNEELQRSLEEALDTRPWVFGFADVSVQNTFPFSFYSAIQSFT